MVWSRHLEEEKKKYNSQKYNATFKNKHAEKLNTKINCEICGGHYTYYSKSKHLKSKKHLNKLNQPNPPNTPNPVIEVNYII